MFRTLATVAAISFAIALLCFAGGIAIAGPEFAKSELWKEFSWGKDSDSDGPVINQSRDLSGFTGVDAGAGLSVDVAVGPDFSVEVIGKNPQVVQMEVRRSSLVIRPQSGNYSWWQWKSLPRVKISMPAIESIESSAGADVNATGIDSTTLALEASAGARIQVDGSCDTLNTDASAGAQIDATSLACKIGNSDVSAGAQTRVHITELINVDASTGGVVQAVGNPTRGKISLSTGGTLSP